MKNGFYIETETSNLKEFNKKEKKILQREKIGSQIYGLLCKRQRI